MDDLISRQAVLDLIAVWAYDLCYKEDEWRAAEEIENLPSAQLEVIRCKDCKQFRRWIDTSVCFCGITEFKTSDNDFCSRAERRTDG